MQVLGVDLISSLDKLVHLIGHFAFNLELLHVRDVALQRVLSEEVSHKNLLDIGLFAEARSHL